MKKPHLATFLALAAAIGVFARAPQASGRTGPAPSGSALAPPSSGGLVLLDGLLKKLMTHRRLLVIGAHPDDENTALLTLVSRKMGGEAAYLSLSRGEGGQNLIGAELGIGLGLIRSQELAAARQLDGGRQFFTRAYDFGFTRSLEETLKKWPREVLLEDAVRVVRRFRPQVIYSVFTGTPRDGHGQHQAAAMVAAEVFRLAGDPATFPSLAKEGFAPWQPRALYRSDWFEEDGNPRVTLPTGDVDSVTGRSYHQIAMASRSLHRSQDMGRLQDPGPNQTGAVWVAGVGVNDGADLFAGLDTRLRGVAAELPEPVRGAAQARLARAEGLAESARGGLSPTRLPETARTLETLLAELRAARESFPDAPSSRLFIDEKIAVAEEALAAAAGVSLDATAAREVAAPGEPVELVVRVWNAGQSPVAVEQLQVVGFEGWAPGGRPEAGPVAANALREWKLTATPTAEGGATVPYFLRAPLVGALYDWSGVPAAVRGDPFQPAPVTAVARVRIGRSEITLSRDAVYRFRDQAIGEVRRPLRAAPPVEVEVDPELLVWPIGRRTNRVEISVRSSASHPVSGQLEMVLPAGWSATRPGPFRLEKAGQRTTFDVTVTAPERLHPGRLAVKVAARLAGDGAQALGIALIDYPHISPTPLPRPAELVIAAAEIRLPHLRAVGYIRGASDRVPESLLSIGVPLEILGARALEAGDLAHFDAIVVGSRAYETDPALARSNGRLLEYARNGGLLIVQYQQYPFIEGGFAPFPLEIARPHDRITDETAPVKLLEPEHPVFARPNRIGAEDWAGWVQERGLYFPRTWDPAYRPLLAVADPGMPEQRGGLLVAGLGKGHYVYTGLAVFRQLPAGVPGAYRLFANLLAWKPGAR